MGLMYQPAVLKKYNLPVPATWAQFAIGRGGAAQG